MQYYYCNDQKYYFFFLFLFSYYSTLLTIQHLQYLLTIWDTYATNNTLLYSIYTYTPTFTYLYNIKRGGGDVEQTFFKKNFQIKEDKKINYAYFPCWFTEKISVIYFTY